MPTEYLEVEIGETGKHQWNVRTSYLASDRFLIVSQSSGQRGCIRTHCSLDELPWRCLGTTIYDSGKVDILPVVSANLLALQMAKILYLCGSDGDTYVLSGGRDLLDLSADTPERRDFPICGVLA